ncbi:hypothetical protein [Paracoccus denitrificans]|jgi:hypothetical protein|uniref:Uncharacterized protein n=1 Tax=Paracoccus denitrificans (strain Pd 1222) TaxID=318586 RepID=A1AY92_PARDP|nr:hypothetical protein [Paracoccus denitrificans]ABL68236.1 conserved hypothetical protein [Paracoccus denitrificans PD1222]MBB4629860.1 hypothetical protein [Paracoccus denitrificans]MCU7430859.1 hypothetical protein [Paracoccus denitrificans]QAR26338.1 hypothetical protein EO213_08500 [Paracoccus denitrificans]UPV95261.1 hypothetical protein M0K93_01305 [Paracoccus denitrificans]
MILILLAVMLTALTCIVAWYLATWALPVMVAVETFRLAHATEAGFLLSVLAAGTAALLSVGLVLLVLFKAKNPILCLLARAVFVIPAMIAGYAVVHGVTHDAIDSAIALKLLCGTAGLITGIAALINLNGFGELAPQA